MENPFESLPPIAIMMTHAFRAIVLEFNLKVNATSTPDKMSAVSEIILSGTDDRYPLN